MKYVTWIVLDVDGTLTDGTLDYGSDGVERKRFNVADGLGIVMAQASGLNVAVISGRSSACVRERMAELKIKRLYEGIGDKALILREMMTDLALRPEQIAYIGDDINDLPAFSVAGVRIAVADAALPLRSKAHVVTGRRGGYGAVREAIERILVAQGRYDAAIKAYLTQNRASSRQ